MSQEIDSYKSLIPFLLGVACCIGLYSGMNMRQIVVEKNSITQEEHYSLDQIQKIKDVLSFIKSKYVDSISQVELTDKTISTLLSQLDPYSEYLSFYDVQQFAKELNGKFSGLGIEVIQIENRTLIYDVIKGSSADKSGLHIGDELVSVDGILFDSLSSDSIVRILRNPNDSTLLIKWKSASREIVEERVLPIEEYVIPSVEGYHTPDKLVGYIKINHFGKNTYRELMEIFEHSIQVDNAKHFIIDIRDNTGGLVHVVADILNQLIYEKDVLMFRTEGANSTSMQYHSLGRPFFQLGKMAILINGRTASAAEILAASLQDLDRAIIVGNVSFGKGTILEQYNLSDGSAIRLATSKFYTYSGRCIQKEIHTEPNSIATKNVNITIDSTTYFSLKGVKRDAGKGVIPDIEISFPQSIQGDFQHWSIQYAKEFVLSHCNFIAKEYRRNPSPEELPNTVLEEYRADLIDKKVTTLDSLQRLYLESEILYECNRVLIDRDTAQKIFLKSDEVMKKAIHYVLQKK